LTEPLIPTSRGKSGNHRGQQLVFGAMHFFLQRLQSITLVNTNNRLIDDRTAIDVLGHVMDGAAGKFRSVTEGLPDSVEPFERGQEARVEIDDFFRKGP